MGPLRDNVGAPGPRQAPWVQQGGATNPPARGRRARAATHFATANVRHLV
eukprot:CAMPEP_0174934656 /NCGR_PEP_ID=MMETSP1355-20121228/50520_1 /TAXON_ID=464990 /ORGANISM="Hemiselmis tepida, Strain CCMP443" /LENGTH=49 /DNA_ID= /DNA_START= /DNA_END= /DNA_ORIENTATION=